MLLDRELVVRITRFTLLILLVLPVAACDDDLGPQFWVAVEDTVVLFSVAREEYTGLPAAYDFLNREPVRIELASAGSWDIALGEDS